MRRLFCINALAPGAGTTLGKPGVLLSPEALLPLTGAVASVVSARPKENLQKQMTIVSYVKTWYSGSILCKHILSNLQTPLVRIR